MLSYLSVDLFIKNKYLINLLYIKEDNNREILTFAVIITYLRVTHILSNTCILFLAVYIHYSVSKCHH